MGIVVTCRVFGMNHKNAASMWTWTLYSKGVPICRSEYGWMTASTATRKAREFLAMMGRKDIPIKTSPSTPSGPTGKLLPPKTKKRRLEADD